MSSALFSGLLGIALGMRHAFEPDHLAAVSTLATEERGARAGFSFGAAWGLGHAATLLLVGGTLVVLEARLPAQVTQVLELAVAVMIVGLGARAVWRAFHEGRRGTPSTHVHGGHTHTHPVSADHLHLNRWTFSTKPLLIGVMHGLAGSGALTALVLPELEGAVAKLTYLALFAAGSVLGMGLLTGLLGVPMRRLAQAPRVAAGVLGLTGVISVGVGCWWGLESGARLVGG